MMSSGPKSSGAPRWSELEKSWAPKSRRRIDVLRDSFPEQRAAALDPARFKVYFTTRRASKTFSFGLDAVEDHWTHTAANYLFLGLVRLEAKRVFWKEVLKPLNMKHDLFRSMNESELTATFHNGATIYVGAADANEDEMRKLLGLKYRKVCIDEAQDWKHTDLDQLVFHTLKPALADHRGSVTLTGTAGLMMVGLFGNVTPSSVQAGIRGERNPHKDAAGWSVHCWDTHANTAVMDDGRTMREHWEEEIRELVAMKGEAVKATPWFRRNYLGEKVVDEDALVYRYQEGRNDFDELPTYRKGEWHFVLGCDLGWNATALGVHAYHDHDPNFYTLQSFRKQGLDLTDTANNAKQLNRELQAGQLVPGVEAEFERWMIDGAAKQSVEEMKRRQDCPWVPADKQGKADFIELHNTDMLLGRVKHRRGHCDDLVGEQRTLIWDQRRLREAGVKEEKSGLNNHCCDETLYAWRECYPYLSTVLPDLAPAAGTEAWRAQQEERATAESARLEAEFLAEGERMQRQRREEEEEGSWL